ncbi:MAG TPA: hypothetical protein VFF70_07985 [Anaerolineae bacterium]|nr:hypothetical protein [Anaerolineae bacterium]
MIALIGIIQSFQVKIMVGGAPLHSHRTSAAVRKTKELLAA